MLRELRANADPVRARAVQQYFKQAVAALGWGTPALRAYATDQLQHLKSSWRLGDAEALCDRLLREPELEVRGLGILILGGFRRQFAPALFRRAEPWLISRLDNWALVDSFCGTVLSPCLEQFPALESMLRRWSRHPILWVRRAALVTLVPFARRGRFLDLTYRLAGAHFRDTEDLMHKATGWLLREAGKTDPRRLARFLTHHGPAIPRTTLRYAIERFPAAERGALLRGTRGES
jgi:3-methyladenine DNA glycosylase AlkD